MSNRAGEIDLKTVLPVEAGSDADRWITLAIYAVCVVAPLLAGSAAYFVHTQPLKPPAGAAAAPLVHTQSHPVNFSTSGGPDTQGAPAHAQQPARALLAESIDLTTSTSGLEGPVRRLRLTPD